MNKALLFCFRIDLSDCELTSLLIFEKEISFNGTNYRKENITFMWVIVKCEMHDLVYSVKEWKLFFNQNDYLFLKFNYALSSGAYSNPIETCTVELDGMKNLQTV